MLTRLHKPGPPLSHFVDLFWLYEGYSQPHTKERLLPDGTMELVINLKDDVARIYDAEETEQCKHLRGAIVCGPHSKFFVIDTAEQESVIGVHFKPGGAFPFLHLTAGEIQDAHVSLDMLWGRDADRLRERLLMARTPEAKFDVLEQTLLAQADRPLARHPAVSFALKELEADAHGHAIADLTDRVGLSARRFIEVFREEVGLTPKLFCRVQRFQQVLGLVGMGRNVAWVKVALACGYFDQAHFNRDFRAFSGINPTTYLAHRTEHRNHVPLVD
jgi:AraC-like DNA-binding protein